MPNRYKPSTWQPKGLLADWEHLNKFTPRVLDSIVASAEISDPDEVDSLKQAVWDIVSRFEQEKHIRSRPSTPEKRAVLNKIAGQLKTITAALNELRTTLEALDSDTRDILLISTGFSPQEVQDRKIFSAMLFGSPPDVVVLQQSRVESAASEIAGYLEIVESAQRHIGPGRLGRPEKTAEYEAVRRLAIAWGVAKGAKPTRRYDWLDRNEEYGEFKKFAQAALDPLGVQVSDEMAKEAIARMKK